MMTHYNDDDAPYARYGKLKRKDIVALLNRRVQFHKRAQEVKDNANEYHKQAERELHYLLGRITAHKMNIRQIGND